jgi:hypothetical protein
MSHRLLFMAKKLHYDEGTSFPLGSLQIQTLYRNPGYLTQPLPQYNRLGNYVIAGNNSIGAEIANSVGSRHDEYLQPMTILSPQQTTVQNCQFVYGGLNTINLSPYHQPGDWAEIFFAANYSSSLVSFSGLYLIFDDTEMTFKQAVETGRISPLVLIYSQQTQSSYTWTNILDIYDGGGTAAAAYPYAQIYLKPVLKGIKGIKFTANSNWNQYGCGVRVAKMPFRLSLSSIIK